MSLQFRPDERHPGRCVVWRDSKILGDIIQDAQRRGTWWVYFLDRHGPVGGRPVAVHSLDDAKKMFEIDPVVPDVYLVRD